MKKNGSEEFGDSGKAGNSSEAEEFARDIEALGPTFIKLGQLLYTRAELLPPVSR